MDVDFTFNSSYNIKYNISSYSIRANGVDCQTTCPNINSCLCVGLLSRSTLFTITSRNSYCENRQSCPNTTFAICKFITVLLLLHKIYYLYTGCNPEGLGELTVTVGFDPSRCPYINGTVTIDNGLGCFRPDDGIGSSANFTCDAGYSLIGNVERICYNGSWSGSRPTCNKCMCNIIY